jgi:hypothetical protein
MSFQLSPHARDMHVYTSVDAIVRDASCLQAQLFASDYLSGILDQ